MLNNASAMASARNTQILTVTLASKRLPRPVVDAARRAVHRLVGFEQFNAVYRQLPACPAADFSRTFLEALRVRVELAGQPRDTIPANGPLIVIANHPFGLLDGMVLETLLMSVRPDVTLVVVHLFAAIPECRERCIFVSPRGSPRRRNRSASGLRQVLRGLFGGRALLVFPAARLARFQWRRWEVADQPWSPHVAAIARRTGAPVLPVYLRSRTSRAFQLVGIVWPFLQNLRALGAVSSHRGRTVQVIIGRLIQPGELSGFATDEEATTFLRHQTEQLAGS
jgi:putative hemolysin